MKKILCTLIAVVLMAVLTVSAFAATIETATGSDSSDVKGKYVTSTRTDVYSVEISWGAMEFDYNEGRETWNTETHKWEADPNAPAEWKVNNNSNTITLANNSSVAVDATFAFAANDGYTALSGSFTYNNAALTSALELELPEENIAAKQYVVAFTPSGSIPDTHSATAYAKMGTITVTLG